MGLPSRRYQRKKPVTRRPYNMKRRMIARRKKYTGVKYFTERIQFPNLIIQPNSNTEGNYAVFNFASLTNNQAIEQLFDLFSVVSLKYEIRPINSYTFGTSPIPAPNITYALEENPDFWVAPTAKAQIMDKATSKTRTLDTQKTSVINVYQKLPQCSSSEMSGSGGSLNVTTLDANRRKFKWYSIPDINSSTSYPKFGALRYWVELPNGTVGNSALDVAELYMTVRYAVKDQQ